MTETKSEQNRRLAKVSGVRVQPGTSVRLIELIDGWAVYPDPGATSRRWQRTAFAVLVMLVVVEYLLVQWRAPSQVEGPLAIVIIALFFGLVIGNELSDDLALFGKWRARQQSALRAGGNRALRQALRFRGRARTVGEMNIMLSSIGRTDPVYSFKRVKRADIRRQWWRTVVAVEFVSGRTVTYQVRSPRAAAKLARLFSR